MPLATNKRAALIRRYRQLWVLELSIHKAYRPVMHQLGCVSRDNACTCQCNMAGCLSDQPVHLTEALRPQLFEHEALEQLRSHPLARTQAEWPHLGCLRRQHRSPHAAASCWLPAGRCLPSQLLDELELQPGLPSAGRGSWLPGCRRSGLSSFSMPGALHDASHNKLPAPT